MVDASMAGALGALSLWAGPGPARPAQAAGPRLAESSCGRQGKDSRRILVAYDSRCGTTGGVAEAVAEVLCRQGASVDVRPVGRVQDLSPYRAVLVGSAIHSSKWLSGATEFVKANRQALSRLPVAYFLTCLTLFKLTEETRRRARAFLDPVLKEVPEVKPRDIGLFAGVLDYGKLDFITGLVMRRKMRALGVPEGDFRDWAAIRSWAEAVGPELLGA